MGVERLGNSGEKNTGGYFTDCRPCAHCFPSRFQTGVCGFSALPRLLPACSPPFHDEFCIMLSSLIHRMLCLHPLQALLCDEHLVLPPHRDVWFPGSFLRTADKLHCLFVLSSLGFSATGINSGYEQHGNPSGTAPVSLPWLGRYIGHHESGRNKCMTLTSC